MRRSSFILAAAAVVLESTLALGRTHRRRHRGHHHHLPEVVSDYVRAWRRSDGAALAALLVADGAYIDETGAELTGQDLVDYVAGFADSHFHVVDIEDDDDKVVVVWRVGARGCSRSSLTFRDELFLSDDESRIEEIRSLGSPPTGELAALVDLYASGWLTYQGQLTVSAMVEGGKYYDPSHPDGLSGEALAAEIESLTWAVISPYYDLVVLKDGRVFGRWDMSFADSGYTFLRGYDFLVIQGDEISAVYSYWL